MKIFPEPIGTLRSLGTPRSWVLEFLGVLALFALAYIAYIII